MKPAGFAQGGDSLHPAVALLRRASHDLEDIIAVLDGRPKVVAEIAGSKADLRQFLREACAFFLSERAFLEAVPGHLPPDVASQARASIVLERAREIATLAP